MKHLKLSHELNAEILYKLPFGSQIYTEQNQTVLNTPTSSDKDFICVVPENTGSFVLQFKNEATNEDITYVGIDQFIEGLKNCSNVEFFEAIHTPAGENFLFEQNLNLMDFYTPRMAKAYLGYARRDIKSDFVNRHSYILKSIYYAECIIDRQEIHLNFTNDTIDKLNGDTDNWNGFILLDKINKMRKSLSYV